MSAENLWRVDIVNANSEGSDSGGSGAIWHSINSQVNPPLHFTLIMLNDFVN